MEQKTFLAIVLSFIFLLSYNALVISPQQKAIAKKPTQTARSLNSESKDETVPLSLPAKANPQKETLEVYKTGNFEFQIDKNTGDIKSIKSIRYNYSPVLTHFFNFSSPPSLVGIQYIDNKISFTYKRNNLRIVKDLLSIDDHTILIRFRYENLSNLSILENVQFNLFDIDIPNTSEYYHDKVRDSSLFEYSLYSNNTIYRKSNAFKFSPKENKSEGSALGWAGWRDRYHFVVVKPEFQTSSYNVNALSDSKLLIKVQSTDLQLKAGEVKSLDAKIFIGPQDMTLLRQLDNNIGQIMAFSRYGFLDFIEKLIYHLLLFMGKIIPNWGICIILISLFIYGITYPLTLKSMLSMRKMQELQPKMAELREKYKNNPQKLNEEVIQLYKIHNVNPLSGCLPVLIQMPVFISLYQVLWRTYNFQGASFLWIKDLSEPDRLAILPITLPFIGNELNLLPILMSIVMFFQQRFSTKNTVFSDPSQEMQQKMMLYIMPIFIGAIFYHFASGLTLYFTVFYLLSALTQYKMSKLKNGK